MFLLGGLLAQKSLGWYLPSLLWLRQAPNDDPFQSPWNSRSLAWESPNLHEDRRVPLWDFRSDQLLNLGRRHST